MHDEIYNEERADLHCSETSGPLPDPDTLAKYDAIAPGTAQRLIDDYSRQCAEEHQQRLTQSRQRTITTIVGTLAALIVCIVAMITGSLTLLDGSIYEGLAISGTGLIGLALAFIKSTNNE